MPLPEVFANLTKLNFKKLSLAMGIVHANLDDNDISECPIEMGKITKVICVLVCTEFTKRPSYNRMIQNLLNESCSH